MKSTPTTPQSSVTAACRVCETPTPLGEYHVRERMFGTEDDFLYRTCPSCGARSIETVPEDLARYYAGGYYSFVGRPSHLKRLYRALIPHGSVAAFLALDVPKEARVLDVGCGAGDFVEELARRGYRTVTGIDPFLPAENEVDRQDVRIRRASVEQLESGAYDVVTLHHVFEHTAEPVAMLREVRRVMAHGGRALVRTPLSDSWVARRYGPDWVQHDPPRHLVVHTSRSVAVAAERAGLQVVLQWRDENGWSAWAGKTLAGGRNPFEVAQPLVRLGRTMHVPAAKVRNRRGEGDQGCFVLAAAAGS